MSISFLRVDDRIIHGQVVMRWARELPCEGIIAVNDDAAASPLLRSALKAATEVRVLVYSVADFLERSQKAIASSTRYFTVTKDPLTMLTHRLPLPA